jgi:hypothetical protein
MSSIPKLLTMDMKRVVLVEGLGVLQSGIDNFREWANNYRCVREGVVPGERHYLRGFRYYVEQGIADGGFKPFNPTEHPKQVDKILGMLEGE